MTAITEALQQCCADLKSDATVWVAFSGGLDSSVLLHAMAQVCEHFPELKLKAIHIDHQLQDGSHNWASHCADVCQRSDIEYQLITVEVATGQGFGPEQAARLARYGALEKLIDDGDLLVTAHHQNDQAETLILQLLRAGGLEGLAAMPYSKAFGKGTHVRPFLDIPRQSLEEYAHDNKLFWIEDPSNQELEFRRNYVRHKLLPLMLSVWPEASVVISQTSRNLSSSLALLNSYLDENLQHLLLAPDVLSVPRLAALDEQKQRHLLRHWYASLGLSRPGEAKLNLILEEVVNARAEATPELRWQDSLLTRNRNLLFLLPGWKNYPEQNLQLVYGPEIRTNWWDWKLSLPAGIDAGDCRVEYGDYRGTYQQNNQTRKLKVLFKEQGLPRYLRPLMPRLVYQGEICLVPGLYVSQAFQSASSEFDFKRLMSVSRRQVVPLTSVLRTY